jgi:hypothetical protein
MDATKTTTEATSTAPAGRSARPAGTRRRWEMTSANVRYFLPKAGSSHDKPELGREMPSEGEALVEAFRTGQFLFTLVAWKAAPELDDDGPRIVKQAMNRS